MFHEESGVYMFHEESGVYMFHEESGADQFHEESGADQFHEESGADQFHDDKNGVDQFHNESAIDKSHMFSYGGLYGEYHQYHCFYNEHFISLNCYRDYTNIKSQISASVTTTRLILIKYNFNTRQFISDIMQ